MVLLGPHEDTVNPLEVRVTSLLKDQWQVLLYTIPFLPCVVLAAEQPSKFAYREF